MQRDIYKTWNEIKLLLTLKKLQLQYHEDAVKYWVFLMDEQTIYFTELWKDVSAVKGINETQNNIDLTDFEDNYKDNANQSMIPVNEEGVPKFIIEGIDENVIVNVSGIPRFRPKLYQNTTDIEVSSGNTITVFEYTSNGQIDFISLNLEKRKWEVILEVDGNEIYRLNMEMIRDKHKLNDPQNYIHTDSSSEFVDYYPTPVDFTINFKIKVKNLDISSKVIRASLIRYREAIPQ